MKLFRLISIAALSLVSCLAAMAVDYTPKYQFIENPNYPTSDLAVATYNILDYGADPTGQEDCARLIQTLCDKIAGKGTKSTTRGDWQNICGGVLYIPEGTYLMGSAVIVPVGVTIRGVWKQPTTDSPASGTILKVAFGRGSTKKNQCLFTMQPCTQICNLSVWYPDQDINDIQPYPATFRFGASGFWGNEYCNVRNVTMINSYHGVYFDEGNGGACPNIWNVYGSPLYIGVSIDNIADVGRIDGAHFSPDYWANSGLPGAPSRDQIAAYTYEHATAVKMMRNDWTYACNVDADSYNVGFHAASSNYGKPNGHNYNFNFNHCKTGVFIDGTSGVGIMFTRVNTNQCLAGVRMNAGCDGPAQFYECTFQGNSFAAGVDGTAGATMMLQDCKLYGDTQILSGQLIADGNTFNGNVNIGTAARTIFAGNTVKGNFNNNSLYECVVSDKKTPHSPIPEYKAEWMRHPITKPASGALAVVTDPEFGCVPLHMTDPLDSAPDCSEAIQRALNKVGSLGGGIVYLPAGHYRMNSAITIPDGVELKGASDLPATPHGHGAILECFADEGNENAAPFINMGVGSGLRGVCVNYPNQTTPNSVKKYPFTVRGNKNVYIVNFSMRAAYKGVDLFTNKCDNHFVDYIAGHAFMNVITVGGGSANGTIANIQCNTIAYGAGFETKFGNWPNSQSFKANNSVCGRQNARDLDFLVLEDTDGEILYNNFLYGCNKGLLTRKGANGRAPRNTVSLGNAVDGAVNTFVFDALETDLDLTNSQIVALNSDADNLKAYFVTTGADCAGKTINFFSSDLWGGGAFLAKVASGTVNMINTRCEQSGTSSSFNISAGAKVNVLNGLINNVKKLVTLSTSTPLLAVNSAVIDPTGATTKNMASYENNLATAWKMGTSNALLPRTGWTVSASNDPNGTNGAKRAIDGSASTRWDTGKEQVGGEWFMVDFGGDLTFNALLLDAMGSPSDGPAAYNVEVQKSGSEDWTKVAEGEKGSPMLIVTFDKMTVRKLRINQTGKKAGNYWSIHELNVGMLDAMSLDDIITNDIETIETIEPARTISNGVYDLQGRRLGDKEMLRTLPGGIYIVNGKTIIKK